jgi:hypothetical protein
MHARNDEIEGQHCHVSQHLFDKRLAPCALFRGVPPMHAMEQFRGGNRGDGGRFLSVLGQHGVEAQPLSFDSDQDAGINQRGHGEGGSGCWCLVISSKVSQYSSSGFGTVRNACTKSATVRVAGRAGMISHTGSPPRSMTNSSPR